MKTEKGKEKGGKDERGCMMKNIIFPPHGAQCGGKMCDTTGI